MTPSPPNITSLEPGEIFVFGSNLAGFHGAGAAAFAFGNFDAEWGVGEGPTGQCYAIPTKDRNVADTLSLEKIRSYVNGFIFYATHTKPDLTFLVTEIGCGYAGYTPEEIAPLFWSWEIPENVRLPQRFIDLKP